MASTEEIPERCSRLPGPNLSAICEDPVHPIRGEGVWDADGRKY